MVSRVLRPRFGSGLVLGALLVGMLWLGTSGPLSTSGTIDVQYAQIRSIHLQPVPEGPTGPLFVARPRRVGDLPLELVRDFVVTPLPAPLHQPHCGGGGDLVIVLKGSGRRIVYGPCRWPWQVSELWGAMIESGEAVACASHRDLRSHVCEGLLQARRRPFRTSF